jgi:copper(I)-binding protein
MMLKIRCLLLVMVAFVASAHADERLSVMDAHVMLAPPGVSVTAGLMTLVNHTGQEIVVHSITAVDFERVELHKTEVVDGVARMIAQHALRVPPNGELVLAHGGYHMMLYAPQKGFGEGDTVTLTLDTSIGDITILAPVKRLTM